MAIAAYQWKIRNKLIDYCNFVFPNYGYPKHLSLMADELEKLVDDEYDILIFQAPPRGGKSELTSKIFPSYYLGKYPDNSIIHASHTASLSNSFSREVRNWMETKLYKLIFPVSTQDDARSVHNWRIADCKGGFFSTGVGGAATGHGANLFIIDDPFKNQEEAESQTIRDKVWAWYLSVAQTRLDDPDAKMIITMTRWHKDDLIGRILKDEEMNKKRIKIIKISAICEDEKKDILNRKKKESYWPERWSAEHLLTIKNERDDMSSKVWAALYQQEPTDPKSKIVAYEQLDKETKPEYASIKLGGADSAFTEKEKSCSNALVVGYTDYRKSKIWIDKVFCQKISPNGFINYIIAEHKMEKFTRLQIEDNGGGEVVCQWLEKESKEARNFVNGVQLQIPIFRHKSINDKRTRVLEMQPFLEKKKIVFNEKDPGCVELMKILDDYDNAIMRDSVDALYFIFKAYENIIVHTGNEEEISLPQEEGSFCLN